MNLKLSHKRFAALKASIIEMVPDTTMLENILGSIKLHCDYDETANTYSREVYERRKQKLKAEGKSMYSNYQREYYARNKETLNKKRVEAWKVAKDAKEAAAAVATDGEAPKKRGPKPKVSDKKHKVCHCGRGCRSVGDASPPTTPLQEECGGCEVGDASPPTAPIQEECVGV